MKKLLIAFALLTASLTSYAGSYGENEKPACQKIVQSMKGKGAPASSSEDSDASSSTSK